jgi:hypothetical protein
MPRRSASEPERVFAAVEAGPGAHPAPKL